MFVFVFYMLIAIVVVFFVFFDIVQYGFEGKVNPGIMNLIMCEKGCILSCDDMVI